MSKDAIKSVARELMRLCTAALVVMLLTHANPALSQTSQPVPAGAIKPAPVNQQETGHWNANNGATINRPTDRDFFGAGTANSGNNYSAVYQNCIASDWLTFNQCSTFRTPIGQEWSNAAQVYMTNSNYSIAGLTLAVGCHDQYTLALGCTAISAVGVGDASRGSGPVYALYGLCQRQNIGSGPCYGIETDPSAIVATTASDPFQQGNDIGYQDACGGQYPLVGLVNCSAAMQIEPNGASFKTGIVFARDSIAPGGYSLAAPAGLVQAWYSSAGVIDGTLGDVGGAMMSSVPYRPPQLPFARLVGSPVVGDYAVIVDAATCTANVAVTAGGGKHVCPVIRGTNNWIAAITN